MNDVDSSSRPSHQIRPPAYHRGRPRAAKKENAFMTEEEIRLFPKWYTVAEVAEMLGYGETKVRMLIARAT